MKMADPIIRPRTWKHYVFRGAAAGLAVGFLIASEVTPQVTYKRNQKCFGYSDNLLKAFNQNNPVEWFKARNEYEAQKKECEEIQFGLITASVRKALGYRPK